MRNLHIKFDVVSVEFIVLVVEEFMALLLEVVDDLFEMFSQFVHTFQIVFGEGLELLDSVENIN